MTYHADEKLLGAAMGYVYFAQAQALGLVKIGYAADVNKRMSELRSQSPDRLAFLGYIETPLAKSLEAKLHMRFAACREHGEWFRPRKVLLSYIASKATPPQDAHWADVALCELYGSDRMWEHAKLMAPR